MQNQNPNGPIQDPRVNAVIEARATRGRRSATSAGSSISILIDGWPRDHGPSLARDVIEITASQLRSGGYVMNDNAEPDFLEFVRDPKNGFLSITLPLKGGTELCLKVP
jgi:hypothetical protein